MIIDGMHYNENCDCESCMQDSMNMKITQESKKPKSTKSKNNPRIDLNKWLKNHKEKKYQEYRENTRTISKKILKIMILPFILSVISLIYILL